MKKFFIVTVTAIVALTFGGCDPAQTESNLFPTAVGNSWRYEAEMVMRLTDAGDDTLWTQVTNLRVTGTIPLGAGGDAAVFVATDSLRQRMPWDTLILTSDTSWILKTPDWVLDYAGPNDNRPDTMLALPLEQSRTWQVFARGDTTVWATVVGKSDVSVPAGTFAGCWEVEYEYSIPGGSFKRSHWYAEDVGWVRGRSRFSGGESTITTEQRLTGYEVK